MNSFVHCTPNQGYGTIFYKPIGPENNPNPSNMSTIDINDPNVQSVIQAAIAVYTAAYPPERKPAGERSPAKDNALSSNNSTPRWNTNEVGFFYPDYDNKLLATNAAKAMEYKGKNTFFRDVYLFLEHVTNYAYLKGAELIRSNL